MQTKHKKQRLSYKEKTNFPSGNGSDISCYLFLNIDDVIKISDEIFRELEIDNEYLLKVLNRVISFSIVTKFTKFTPGKSDKRNLVKRTCGLAKELKDHLEILVRQYGYETYKHIPILTSAPGGWVKDDTCDFLKKLQSDCGTLANTIDVAAQNIEKDSGKKTGNNSKDSVPNLIFHLVSVYEELTGNNAKENFQQDSAGERPFKGQFYDFVYALIKKINDNFQAYPQSGSDANPFEIDFKNKEEESYSLGKYIKKVFRQSQKP